MDNERQFENEREWRQFLIAKLDCIEKKVVENRIEISVLKTKAAMWGAIAGSVPATLLLLLQLLTRFTAFFNVGGIK